MSVTLQWPGGEHEFYLGIGQLRKLQDSCNAGPEEVFTRLRLGTWRINDIIEPLRLGLIGGGMATDEAARTVTTIVEQYPKVQFKLTALAIMADALLGPKDDPVGEDQGEAAPPENGGSQGSMQPVQ